MFAAEIKFTKGASEGESFTDVVYTLLGCWEKNGQIADTPWTVADAEDALRAYVMVPSRDSLDERFANKYVREYLAKYLKITSSVPQITILGPDPDSAPACGCENPVDYILFTNLMTVESPIRCAECFHPVPLYLLPFTDDEEHLDALSWVSDYKACDTLQMHCTVGERFGEQQMLRHDSALSKSGRELCRKLEAKIQGKVYYFLHKYRGRSVAAERKRLCPECDRSWILADQWHGLFDFRCEHCRLLSNIASSLKQW